jgi:hypothetical protein
MVLRRHRQVKLPNLAMPAAAAHADAPAVAAGVALDADADRGYDRLVLITPHKRPRAAS